MSDTPRPPSNRDVSCRSHPPSESQVQEKNRPRPRNMKHRKKAVVSGSVASVFSKLPQSPQQKLRTGIAESLLLQPAALKVLSLLPHDEPTDYEVLDSLLSFCSTQAKFRQREKWMRRWMDYLGNGLKSFWESFPKTLDTSSPTLANRILPLELASFLFKYASMDHLRAVRVDGGDGSDREYLYGDRALCMEISRSFFTGSFPLTDREEEMEKSSVWIERERDIAFEMFVVGKFESRSEDEEEDDVIQQALVPFEIFCLVLEFLGSDFQLLQTLGLVSRKWRIAVIRTWSSPISLRDVTIFHIPVAFIRNANRFDVRFRDATAIPHLLDYFVNNLQPNSNCEISLDCGCGMEFLRSLDRSDKSFEGIRKIAFSPDEEFLVNECDLGRIVPNLREVDAARCDSTSRLHQRVSNVIATVTGAGAEEWLGTEIEELHVDFSALGEDPSSHQQLMKLVSSHRLPKLVRFASLIGDESLETLDVTEEKGFDLSFLPSRLTHLSISRETPENWRDHRHMSYFFLESLLNLVVLSLDQPLFSCLLSLEPISTLRSLSVTCRGPIPTMMDAGGDDGSVDSERFWEVLFRPQMNHVEFVFEAIESDVGSFTFHPPNLCVRFFSNTPLECVESFLYDAVYACAGRRWDLFHCEINSMDSDIADFLVEVFEYQLVIDIEGSENYRRYYNDPPGWEIRCLTRDPRIGEINPDDRFELVGDKRMRSLVRYYLPDEMGMGWRGYDYMDFFGHYAFCDDGYDDPQYSERRRDRNQGAVRDSRRDQRRFDRAVKRMNATSGNVGTN